LAFNPASMAGAREAEILKIDMQCLNPENRIS
jgi:hypothetical protein